MRNHRALKLSAAMLLAFGSIPMGAAAAEAYKPGVAVAQPNLEGQVARPLRYRPEGEDFVIHNGEEFFNRPLYGGNTGFRVDGGDRPEFSLYLPGRGGNVRLGLKTPAGVLWLHRAHSILARYRPGELHYELADPLLGAAGRNHLAAVAYAAAEGLGLRVRGEALPEGAELVFAFAPGNGALGRRGGDIGTEQVPISEYFQFAPKDARAGSVELQEQGFKVATERAVITATSSRPVAVRRADAAQWDQLVALLGADGGKDGHVAVGRLPLDAQGVHLAFQVASNKKVPELAVYREAGSTLDTGPAKASPRPPRCCRWPARPSCSRARCPR